MADAVDEEKRLRDEERRIVGEMVDAAMDARWPPSLVKAIDDEFDYGLQLRNGAIIYFTRAEYVSDDWVRVFPLDEVEDAGRTPFDRPPLQYSRRGVEVRVSAIEWVADAPGGS